MIRSELITELSNKHPQLTASDVELAVKTIIDSLANCLAKGGRVEMRGVAVSTFMPGHQDWDVIPKRVRR
jgi:nucleoid DNA-binding protein